MDQKRLAEEPSLSFGFGDDRRGMLKSKNVSLTIFIISMSSSKCLTSFTNRFFHFSRPPSLRLTFDAAEKIGKFGRIQCHRRKESSSRGKRKRPVFLCRSTVRVKIKSKVIPTSFLKTQGREAFVGAKDLRKRTVSRIGS